MVVEVEGGNTEFPGAANPTQELCAASALQQPDLKTDDDLMLEPAPLIPRSAAEQCLHSHFSASGRTTASECPWRTKVLTLG